MDHSRKYDCNATQFVTPAQYVSNHAKRPRVAGVSPARIAGFQPASSHTLEKSIAGLNTYFAGMTRRIGQFELL